MDRARIPNNGVDNGDWQSVWGWRAESKSSVKDGDELVDMDAVLLERDQCSFDFNALSIPTLSNVYRPVR